MDDPNEKLPKEIVNGVVGPKSPPGIPQQNTNTPSLSPIPYTTIPYTPSWASWTTEGLDNINEYDLSRKQDLKYPFECWGDDGKIYLHEKNWNIFRRKKESDFNGYPHNWLHRRMSLLISNPCKNINDIPGFEGPLNFVEEDWSVIWEPYPAHFQNQRSFHIWIEDKHPKPTYGEPVVLMSIEPFFPGIYHGRYVYFMKEYWKAEWYCDYGLGSNPPSEEESKRFSKKKPKTKYRDIYEDWQPAW